MFSSPTVLQTYLRPPLSLISLPHVITLRWINSYDINVILIQVATIRSFTSVEITRLCNFHQLICTLIYTTLKMVKPCIIYVNTSAATHWLSKEGKNQRLHRVLLRNFVCFAGWQYSIIVNTEGTEVKVFWIIPETLQTVLPIIGHG